MKSEPAAEKVAADYWRPDCPELLKPAVVVRPAVVAVHLVVTAPVVGLHLDRRIPSSPRRKTLESIGKTEMRALELIRLVFSILFRPVCYSTQ